MKAANGMQRAAVTGLAAPIHAYRLSISPLFAPVARFEPTGCE